MDTTKLESSETVQKVGFRNFFTRLFREKKLGALGMIIVISFLLVGIFAESLAPYGIRAKKILHRLKGPSLQYPLGTDHLGRDQLSRIIYGARVSMIVSLSATAIGLVIALSIGLVSGYWGGKFDLVVQRFVDAWLTFPWLFIVLTIMSLLGQGLLQMIVVLGAFTGIGNIRMVRGVVMTVKENDYVKAALALGCSTSRILIKHILPQIWPPIIVVFTVNVGAIMLSEATISFLGFGIAPPQPSWGSMLSMEGRKYMEAAPALALLPGLLLAIVVYGINMFGDAMRDLLDPKLRGAGL